MRAFRDGKMCDVPRDELLKVARRARVGNMIQHAKKCGKRLATTMLFRREYQVGLFEKGLLRNRYHVQAELIDLAVASAQQEIEKRKLAA